MEYFCRFSKAKAVAYAKSRLYYEYSCLVKIFYEMKRRDENYQPRTIFDFGSGVGSVLWYFSKFLLLLLLLFCVYFHFFLLTFHSINYILFFRACNNMWPKSIYEHYCVEKSSSMIEVADLLLRGKKE